MFLSQAITTFQLIKKNPATTNLSQSTVNNQWLNNKILIEEGKGSGRKKKLNFCLKWWKRKEALEEEIKLNYLIKILKIRKLRLSTSKIKSKISPLKFKNLKQKESRPKIIIIYQIQNRIKFLRLKSKKWRFLIRKYQKSKHLKLKFLKSKRQTLKKNSWAKKAKLIQ